jgi:hypothetical protein
MAILKSKERNESKESKERQAFMNKENFLPSYDLAGRLGITLRGHETKHSPCPSCGGVDRFAIKFSSTANKQLWMCNQCHPKWGDAIEYEMFFHGVTYPQAITALGIEAGSPPARTFPKPQPPATIEMPPAKEWQANALNVIAECEKYLWSDEPKAKAARQYLYGRGLSDETIKAYRLGYNRGDRKISGLWLFEGVTLPTIINGEVWQVRLRIPPKHVGRTVFNSERTLSKYEGLTGGRVGMLGIERVATSHTVLLFGGEFDTMLAQQHAPPNVACATFGSETKNLYARWRVSLHDKRLIVVYDNDTAGNEGFIKIRDMLPSALRARSPVGKDIGEYFTSGGDVTAWIVEIVTGLMDIYSDAYSEILAWLEAIGYEPVIGEQGQILATKVGQPSH